MAVGDRYKNEFNDHIFEVVFEDQWGKLLEFISGSGREVHLRSYWTNLEIREYFTPLTEKV